MPSILQLLLLNHILNLGISRTSVMELELVCEGWCQACRTWRQVRRVNDEELTQHAAVRYCCWRRHRTCAPLSGMLRGRGWGPLIEDNWPKHCVLKTFRYLPLTVREGRSPWVCLLIKDLDQGNDRS